MFEDIVLVFEAFQAIQYFIHIDYEMAINMAEEEGATSRKSSSH
jgi:hypothetical protein